MEYTADQRVELEIEEQCDKLISMKLDFSDKKILVTGASGFIGSHLVDRLLLLGGIVVGVDNFITSSNDNLRDALANPHFSLIKANVSEPPQTYLSEHEHFDFIFHFASPASPVGYMDNPVETYRVNSFGTHYLVEYATKIGARIMISSTSEAYGDPLEHPQKETYWGNVNPVGVRSCYDESKRFGEMVVSTWARAHGTDTRIVRIFNTYGPRMAIKDGRVVPNFVKQALKNEPITVHGNGEQTRSFCYVSDLIEFIVRDMLCEEARGEVINIGNPGEVTMLDYAKKIIELSESKSEIVFIDRPEDDPNRREPDITKAKRILGYEPQVSVEEGMKKTIEYFKQKLSE